MASMNGISINSLRSFKTEEGIAWQGEIYLADKKIGEWSNDSYGGPDSFQMEEGYSFEKLKKELCRFYPEWGNSPEEFFMYELMKLTNRETIYKNRLAEYSCDVLLVVTDRSIEMDVGLPGYSGLTDQIILLKEKDYINELKEKLRPEDGHVKHQALIYRNLEQFSVGEEIDLVDIMQDI